MKKTNKYTTIDEYIKTFPKNTQDILQNIRQAIKDSSPEASETISYQMPTFKLNGNLVHFAAFKNHIGFYPTPSGINLFKKELAQYKTSKGAIQFPINKTIPLSLIRKIVKHRTKENIGKK